MMGAALLFLAQNSKVIHAAHGYIPPLIGAMGNELMHLKWKYLDAYERLNSDRIIGISIGPFDSITYQMVFEV